MDTQQVTRRPASELAGLTDPFAGFGEVLSRFDRMFGDFGRGGSVEWAPPLDVRRTDDALHLHVDVPGMEPDEVKIRVSGGLLSISGEHSEESEEERAGYLRRERRRGSFRRALALPPDARPDEIEATVKNGVAEITVPLRSGDEHAVEITAKAG